MRLHVELRVAADWWPLVPSDPARMVGGTERVVVRLARELARRGHEVTLRGGGAEGRHEAVRFVSERTVVGRVDTLVCVQADPPPDVEATLRIAWSHAAQWPRSDDWDAAVTGSRYHAGVLRDRLPDLPIDVVPPGIDLEPDTGRPCDRFLYASSPDRGLHRLLAIWPELWRVFGVPLAIAYDVRAVFARYAHTATPLAERLRHVEALLEQPGIIVHGALSEDRLRALRARSLALLYPLDPVLPHSELLSLAVREACAAGCPPLLAPVDAFPSEYGEVARLVEPGGPRYDAETWIAAIRETLDARPERASLARRFAHAFRWEDWLDGWEAVLRMHPRRRPFTLAAKRWVVIAADTDRELARAFVDAAEARGHTVRVVPPTDEAIAAVAAGAERIVVASSLGCSEVLGALERVAGGTPIVSLEATLPEWLERFPAISLALVAWPQTVVDRALDGPTPLFPVSHAARARLRAVGWLPRAGTPFEPTTIDLPVGLEIGDVAACAPDALAIGTARAAGRPVLVLAPGRAFSDEPYRADDRFAHALFLAGEAEVVHGDRPPDAWARCAEVARGLPAAPSGGGAELAVRLVEALVPPSPVWRPPELRA